MKILHLATHAGVFRGGAVQLCRMAQAQARAGHEVRIVAQLETHCSESRQRKDRESWEPIRASGIGVDMMSYANPPGVLDLRAFIRQHRFDIVHAHRDDALLAARVALIGMDRPKLVAQRGTTSAAPFLVASAFRSGKVCAIVAVAEAVKKSLVEEAGVDPGKVHVIYGSVDLEQFAPAPPNEALRAGLNLPEDAVIIGSISAYRKAKGFGDLVRALKQVFEANPNSYALFLGEKTDKHVLKKAKRAGIADRCRFVGHQSNVHEWLSLMDVTVIAATGREGLSGVLRESLAMEVPVVSTDTSGNGEIVRDGETGLLVPVGKPEALGAALCRALDDPEGMKRMAKAGRAWVSSHCTPEVHAEKLLALYAEVIGGGAGD